MTTTLTVRGMSCEGCERNVVAAVEDVQGVESAEADRDAERVRVDGDVDPSEVAAAIEEAGYEIV